MNKFDIFLKQNRSNIKNSIILALTFFFGFIFFKWSTNNSSKVLPSENSALRCSQINNSSEKPDLIQHSHILKEKQNKSHERQYISDIVNNYERQYFSDLVKNFYKTRNNTNINYSHNSKQHMELTAVTNKVIHIPHKKNEPANLKKQLNVKLGAVYKGQQLQTWINKLNFKLNQNPINASKNPLNILASMLLKIEQNTKTYGIESFLNDPGHVNDSLLTHFNTGTRTYISQTFNNLQWLTECCVYILNFDHYLLGYDHFLLATRLQLTPENEQSTSALVQLQIAPSQPLQTSPVYLRGSACKKFGTLNTENKIKYGLFANGNFRMPVINVTQKNNPNILITTRACTKIEFKKWTVAYEAQHNYGQNLIPSSIQSVVNSPLEFFKVSIHDLNNNFSITKYCPLGEFRQAVTINLDFDSFSLQNKNALQNKNFYLTTSFKPKGNAERFLSVAKVIIQPGKIFFGIGSDNTSPFDGFS